MMSYRISIKKRDKRGERDGCRKRIKQKERGRGAVGSVVEALGKGDSVSYELQIERPLSSEAWAAVETVPRKYGNHLLTIALRLQIINLEFGVIVTKIQNLAASHSFLSAWRHLIWNRGHSFFAGGIAAGYLPGRDSRQTLISCPGRLIPLRLHIPHIADKYGGLCQCCSCVQIRNL